MSTETTRTADILAVVQAFDAACNANEVDRALELFADDAVVTQLPPPSPDPGMYRGKQQIRAWLELLLQQFHVAARNYRAAGERVTWDATISADVLRRMGLASVEDTIEAVVREGKIASFTLTISPDSLSQITALSQV